MREALSQLEQLGLIRTQPSGARVQSVNVASLAILGPLLALDDHPDPPLVDQFLQTFGVLAALTAKSAVNAASPEQLIQLEKLVVVVKYKWIILRVCSRIGKNCWKLCQLSLTTL